MKFISFEEAIEASCEGRTVSSWLDSESKPYNVHYAKCEVLNGKFKMEKFVLLGDEVTRFNEVKWTVE